MICRMIRVLLAVILMSLTFSAAVMAAFDNPLTTPSIMSPLIDKVLINGITHIGGRIICVGQRGYIAYSDDFGKSWVQAKSPVSIDLLDVHFPTSQKGWAVGHSGVVLHSTDGGKTWVKQLDGTTIPQMLIKYFKEHPPKNLQGGNDAVERFMGDINQFAVDGPDKPFLSVWFENENSGFVVGAFNLIFHTDDGGKSWEPWMDRDENTRYLHLYSIKGIGRDIFIAGEQGLIMKLDRKVEKFRRTQTPYQGTFFSIFGKPSAIIAVGLRGHMVRSGDGGATWKEIQTGVAGGLAGGSITDDGRLVVVSQVGGILLSTDEGMRFENQKIDKSFPAGAIEAIGKDAVMLVGNSGIRIVKLK